MRPQPFTRTLRLLIALIIVILAFYGLYALLRPTSPAQPGQKIETRALNPISRGEILNQFRVITVERQYRIPVVGRSFKPLPNAATGGVVGAIARDIFGNRDSVPGTTTNIVYEMVTTVTAGIDLSKLTEADIQNGDRTTTITLPAPEVIAVVHDPTESQIFAKDSPALPYMDNSAALLEELQRTGTVKHHNEAENDESLMRRARDEARQSLHSLLEHVHSGREIHILFHPGKNSLPPG